MKMEGNTVLITGGGIGSPRVSRSSRSPSSTARRRRLAPDFIHAQLSKPVDRMLE
jgi:hypothetical protein